MKKVELNFDVTDLEGRKIANAGQLLAGLLMSETKGDAVKYFDWAMTLQKLEPIQLDASDLSKVKALISETEKLTILAKAPILKYLETI
jgi:saccharopine dehydrogenase-like NADP-dependent oxidoreductase